MEGVRVLLEQGNNLLARRRLCSENAAVEFKVLDVVAEGELVEGGACV